MDIDKREDKSIKSSSYKTKFELAGLSVCLLLKLIKNCFIKKCKVNRTLDLIFIT